MRKRPFVSTPWAPISRRNWVARPAKRRGSWRSSITSSMYIAPMGCSDVAVDPLSVRAELLVPRRALLRTAEDELFDLVELVHAEEALRVDAVGPDLPAELGRQAGEAEGQLAVVDHLVHVHRADGMLRRRD